MEYDELVKKLAEDGYIQNKVGETNQNTYFKEALEHLRVKFDRRYKFFGWGTAWDHIRKLVLFNYGVSKVKYLPLDKQEEANKLAIALIDTLSDASPYEPEF